MPRRKDEFTQAIRSVLAKYATFDGRARRSEYWYYSLFLAIVYVAVAILAGAGGENIADMAAVVYLIIAAGTFLPTLAVSARRLHDTDRSGWLMLVSLIPVVGLILLLWTCTRGTLGTNRFGEDPTA